MRTVPVIAALLLVVLTLALTGCQVSLKPAATPVLTPPVEAAGSTQGPNQYQFKTEAGFSQELGARPDFKASVRPYTLKTDLSNVANHKLFKGDLRPEHLRMIAKNGFVVVPADWKQMEFVYELNNYPEVHRAGFITTDSALHCFHIFYDYLLRTMESSTLYDRLSSLALGLLQGAARQFEEATLPEIKEAATRNYAFALVPVQLLEIPEGSWGLTVPAEVKSLTAGELKRIKEHQGMDAYNTFPVVGFKVDYSQFIPRGHYTRSEKLKRYFMAMMWYGLVPLAFRGMDEQLAPVPARQAALLAQVLLYGKYGNEPLGKLWEDIYFPTAFLVGFADDNTPGDFGKALYKLFGEPVPAEKLVPAENLTQLAQQLLSLRPPGIVMASVSQDPTKPHIPQFRVMGQRFVLDSYLMQQMVFPHVGTGQGEGRSDMPGTYNKRTFPMGLDVMSLLGSQRAYEIADVMYQQTKFNNYAEQTQKLRAEVEAYGDVEWSKNAYYGWLHALKLLVEPEGQGYPSFMLTQAWQDKTLNTALGSWAELRHDTILYAKQSVVAECGGGPEPQEAPRGYVEPEVLFWWRLGLLATQLRDGLQQRGLLPEGDLTESFGELLSLYKFLQEVSLKQLSNQPLTEEEYAQIEYYGDKLSQLNLYTKRGGAGDEITSMTDKDMAVVADVHTGSMGGQDLALEEGVGHANEIYVVFPIGDRLYLGRGAVFSYYEFTVPVAERMTDEEWQQKLGSSNPPAPPKWQRSFLSNVRGTGQGVKFQAVPEFTGGGC